MPLKEIEAKAVLSKDQEIGALKRIWGEARDLVISKGGTLDRVVEHRDTYLSHPCRDFKARDECLRIRAVRPADKGEGTPWEVLITFKGPKLSPRSKARYEKEVRASGPHAQDDLLELFSHLGFEKVLVVAKTRAEMDLGGLSVAIDIVEGLGVFAEVEIKAEGVREAEDRVLALMASMGWTDLERRSYLEMLVEKQV